MQDSSRLRRISGLLTVATLLALLFPPVFPTFARTPVESGDTGNFLSGWNLTGASASNTDSGTLYWTFTTIYGFLFDPEDSSTWVPNINYQVVFLYKDSARTQRVASAFAGNGNTGGIYTGVQDLMEDNGSGLTGTVSIDSIKEDKAAILGTLTIALGAPVRSGISPASASTITSRTPSITFTTDENATCKISLTDQAYGDMSVTCTGGGTTSQSCTAPNLGADGAKNVYIACTDGVTSDTVDTNENLSYTLDANPPVASSFSPASASTITTRTPTITFSLNENGDCRASTSGDESYDQMSDDTDCTGDGTQSISCTLPDLGVDGAKTVYVACKDATGNKDTASTNTALSYTLNTVVSSSSSSSSEITGSTGGFRGHRTNEAQGMQGGHAAASSSSSSSAANPFQVRTCDRVLHRFGNDAQMLNRINERLQNRFGFVCR